MAVAFIYNRLLHMFAVNGLSLRCTVLCWEDAVERTDGLGSGLEMN